MSNPTPAHSQLHNAQNPPRPSGPKHDSLHMAEGMRFCWCMCQKCFLTYTATTGKGKNLGICICRQCPCAESYEATKPVYVPYVHIENPHG